MITELKKRIQEVKLYHQITVWLLAVWITAIEKENHELTQKLQESLDIQHTTLAAVTSELEKKIMTLLIKATTGTQQEFVEGGAYLYWLEYSTATYCIP